MTTQRIMRQHTGIHFRLLTLVLLTLATLPSALFAQDGQARRDSSSVGFIGFPVSPFGRTLFSLKTRIGPYSAENRALTITGIIRELANDPFFVADSLKIEHDDDMINVVYENHVVTTITPADSKAEGKPADIIAFERHRSISDAISLRIKQSSEKGLLKSIIFSGIILLLLVLFIVLVNKLYYFLDKKIHESNKGLLNKIRIRDYQLIPHSRQIQLLHFINVTGRYILIILLLVVALWLTSYLLPWTKIYSLIFLQFILSPLKNFLSTLWYFIPNLLTIIVIIFITTLIIKFFRFLKTEVEKGEITIGGFYADWALPVFNIIRFLVWAFAIILIYPHLPGSDSKVFQGVSVLIGLLFSITSASILGNLVAGFALTFTRAFQIGDRIRVGENIGDVVEKTLAVTKIRTIKNEIITIPNSKISTSEVVNYTTLAAEHGLILHTTVTIGYDVPWQQVHQLLINAAKSTDLLLHDPEPFVLQTGLNDFYVSYQVNAFTKHPEMMAVIMSNLHRNIQDSFNNSGVEIMSPHYRAVRDGNTIAIPNDHIPASYTQPSFEVKLKKE